MVLEGQMMGKFIFNPSAYIRTPVEHYPERTCLTYNDKTYTYREINKRSNQLSNALNNLGIKIGSRVATLQFNCNQSFELIIAMWKIGVVMVPLNTRDSAKQHIEIIKNSGATSVIFGREFIKHAQEIKNSLPQVINYICHGEKNIKNYSWLDYENLIKKSSDSEPDIDIDEDALCRISYTSGTTGTPRGVLMTYRNRLAQISNVFMNADYLISKDEVFLHTAPLTHAAGYYAIPFFLKGARHVIMEKFDTTRFLKTVELEKITCVLLVPTMIIMLMQDPNLKKTNLSSLRRIFYGTAPMPFDKLQSALEIFGPIMRQNYGLTESVQPLACLNADEHIIQNNDENVNRLHSTGKRALGIEIRIVDEKDIDLPVGEVGEIILRSPHISIGYYNMKTETENTFRGGWLHTGDLGRFDKNGYLYIVDRKKDMIISGGFNIYSREVEMYLDSHKMVLESAVIGLPDEKWGEICAAFIVTREKTLKINEKELVAHCIGEGLSKYKIPKQIYFIDNLPKNENNKIIKKKLKEMTMKSMSTNNTVGVVAG